MSNVKKLEKKLAILDRSMVTPSGSTLPKTREERKIFWSDVMDSDSKTNDKLKASELLGKTEADFIERRRHEGDPDNPMIWEINIVDPKKDPEEEHAS